MNRASLIRSLATLGGCLLLLAGCGSSTPDQTESVTVGLLLPFTGADSATSSNFERAALFAAKRVNEAGGIGGKPLRIVSQDTHSELERGERSAQWLIDAGAQVVVGPESAAIAPALYPTLTAHGVVLLSPLIGAGEEPTFDCAEPWLRLAPSAKAMGENLAKEIISQKVSEVTIIYADDAYDAALSGALRALFVSRGGAVPLQLKIDPEAQSYAGVVKAALAQGVSSVLLATSARAGALLVNEFDALSGRKIQWFLSPQLKTELFVANVAPDALENALGVAPQIFDKTDAFPDAFAQEWQGDVPLEGAYFYYDAIALLAFGLQQVATTDGAFDLREFAKIIQQVANAPGETTKWNEIASGMSFIREGGDIFYGGLTGPMLLTPCGERPQGRSSEFTVRDGRIVDL